MTDPHDDWARWRETWQEASVAAAPMPVLRKQFQREQRRIVLTGVAEVMLGLAAASGIAVALVHTPSRGAVAWGAFVLVLIAFTWLVDLLRRGGKWLPLAESTQTFLELSQRRCRTQLRAVRFTWILIALELVFMVPWWAGGVHAHAGALYSPLVIFLGWLPMALIAGLFAWSVWLWRRLSSELGRLEDLGKKLRAG
jgi:hypothetical protein